MNISYEIDIRAPKAFVFEYLEDSEKMMQWINGLVEIDYVKPKNPVNPVGATFVQKIEEGKAVEEYKGEIISYDYPHVFGVRLKTEAYAIDVHYRLTDAPDGTRLQYEAELVFGTLSAKLLGSLFGWVTKRMVEEELHKLKHIVEAHVNEHALV